MKFLNSIALLLVIVGALNWGSIGFFKFDFISYLFGQLTLTSRIIFSLVGICGIYSIKFLLENISD
ncbi:DUF378 domain-containing protein [Candidatus Arthromitus sp. SFB-turkey]|uniref:DUF378 domain-containing protein n=1 Tax=Candidatus Arthromitus sp. SFB-turkey TaxID=1840217 RepID=UPI0007F3F480|nr:DUF378 domain-containing protein [Candidatus Arthromitus sp. SFB-turkey]OAT88896.1 DUF378 domain-containing protein [Candidatus Arthromitus sp. SFB-turkey]HJD00122.1 DUF378 domain-containing protein [Candidatus Dwaynia gallinarum]